MSSLTLQPPTASLLCIHHPCPHFSPVLFLHLKSFFNILISKNAPLHLPHMSMNSKHHLLCAPYCAGALREQGGPPTALRPWGAVSRIHKEHLRMVRSRRRQGSTGRGPGRRQPGQRQHAVARARCRGTVGVHYRSLVSKLKAILGGLGNNTLKIFALPKTSSSLLFQSFLDL